MIWLAGADLRAPLLATPPLLPRIHRDLPLNETLVGVLTSLPVLLFALAAIPGSALIARLGARRAVIGGLTVVAVASAVRGYGTSLAMLFGATFVMGLGVALIQPGFPSLVRGWFPTRVGFATALYSNGLLVGESFAAAITLPVVLPLARDSWQAVLAVWSLPVWLTVVLLLGTPRGQPTKAAQAPAGWWPDWRNRNTWVLGFILGCASIAYWASNGFVPDFMRTTQRTGLIAPMLTVLNLSQFPSSLVVAAFSTHLFTRRTGFIAAGAGMLLGFLLLVVLPGAWTLVGAGLIGFSSATLFVIGLALPAVLAPPTGVHRLAAAIFTIQYTCAFVGPVVGGKLWDATSVAALAFLPAILGSVATIVLALFVTMPREPHPRQEALEPIEAAVP